MGHAALCLGGSGVKCRDKGYSGGSAAVQFTVVLSSIGAHMVSGSSRIGNVSSPVAADSWGLFRPTPDRAAFRSSFFHAAHRRYEGLGGRVGSGTQGMSWIHEFDMNCLFERSLTNSEMQCV